jgi:glycosyltransferase involved in cell wall biosynthesis
MVGLGGYHRRTLDEYGIRCVQSREYYDGLFPRMEFLTDQLRSHPEVAMAISRAPIQFRAQLQDLCRQILWERPAVLHAWLDEANVVGGFAGVICGVPRIILSLRNLSPGHFQRFNRPWFRPIYEQLIRHPSVQLVANSQAGASDYAAWLGMPASSIRVVYNGVPALPRSTAQDLLGFRKEHGIPDDARIIAGIMRLDDEKDPLRFVEIVADLVNVHTIAVIAGDGPLRGAVAAAIAARQLEHRILLIGLIRSPSSLLANSHALLLTSRMEGTPNVVLEAQALGCVPVVADVGGCRECILPDQTGYLRDRDDVPGMRRALIGLIEDDALRSLLAERGKAFIQANFEINAMKRAYDRVYAIDSI